MTEAAARPDSGSGPSTSADQMHMEMMPVSSEFSVVHSSFSDETDRSSSTPIRRSSRHQSTSHPFLCSEGRAKTTHSRLPFNLLKSRKKQWHSLLAILWQFLWPCTVEQLIRSVCMSVFAVELCVINWLIVTVVDDWSTTKIDKKHSSSLKMMNCQTEWSLCQCQCQ